MYTHGLCFLAEEKLKELELGTPLFSQLLLAIADGNFEIQEMQIRIASALLFKNFVKRHWPVYF